MYIAISFIYILQGVCIGVSGHGGVGHPDGMGAGHAPSQFVNNIINVWLICWILWFNFMVTSLLYVFV